MTEPTRASTWPTPSGHELTRCASYSYSPPVGGGVGDSSGVPAEPGLSVLLLDLPEEEHVERAAVGPHLERPGQTARHRGVKGHHALTEKISGPGRDVRDNDVVRIEIGEQRGPVHETAVDPA